MVNVNDKHQPGIVLTNKTTRIKLNQPVKTKKIKLNSPDKTTRIMLSPQDKTTRITLLPPALKFPDDDLSKNW